RVSGTSFTWRGKLDDPTATILASISDANGNTNVANGLVERDGNFWVEGLSLAEGTNTLTLTVADAAANTSATNISIVQSPLVLAIDAVSPTAQLWQATVNL